MEGHFLASITNLPPHFNGLALKLPKKFIVAYVSRFPVSRWFVSCFLDPSTPRASVLSLSQWEVARGVGRCIASWCGRDRYLLLTWPHSWMQGSLRTVLTAWETTFQ